MGLVRVFTCLPCFRAPLTLGRVAAASIRGSVELSATTRRIDPAADLREATERNTQEKRDEDEAARRKKAEAEKAAASAQQGLEGAEAAAAAKERVEEATRRQSVLLVVPLNLAPPPVYTERSGE